MRVTSALILGVALIIGALCVGGLYTVSNVGAYAVIVTNRLTGDSFYCYPEKGCFEMNVLPTSVQRPQPNGAPPGASKGATP